MKHTVLKRLLAMLCMLMLLFQVMGGTGLAVYANQFNDGDLEWEDEDGDGEITLSVLPSEVYATIGEEVYFNIPTDRTDLTYKWYYKNRGDKLSPLFCFHTFKYNYKLVFKYISYIKYI